MRLHSITLKNFRLFKDETFEFKPLTILTGPNSSGKSTVVKALMLLQENLKPSNYLGRLTFKSGNHRLGSFESILTSGVKEKTLGFELKFEAENSEDTTRNNQKLFDDVTFFILSYEYVQDPIQKENGVLKSYKISIITAEMNAAEENPDPLNILCVNKDDETSQYFISINFSWLIKNILDKNIFSIRPNIYVIYEKDEKIKALDFNKEFKRRIRELNKQKRRALSLIANYRSKKNSELNHRKGELNKKIILLEEKIQETEKFYENIINNIDQQIDSFEQEGRGIEIEDKKNIIDQNLNQKNHERNQRENERDNAIRQIEEEKHKLQEEIMDYETKIKVEIEEDFEKLKEKVDRGAVRSEVYDQVMIGCRKYLESLAKIEFKYSLKVRDETIADILMKKEWAPGVEDILREKENTRIIDILEWPENLVFIKKILEKDQNPITFRHVVEDNEHNNQFSSLLIENIYFIITEFIKSLPFTPISAMRGFQQRLYQTNQSEFHLEEALSTLLTLQYNNATEKLAFIQQWIKKFRIGHEIKAEVIEGDYVKGFIVDEDENRMNIADKGLGIVQLIPIIIYTAEAIGSNKLICVEEPGTHLHPDLQAKLVEFVGDAIDKGVQFLFETHSEYFIRKLQYQIIHDKRFCSNNVLIRYLNYSKDENKTIRINQEGELVDENEAIMEQFGVGFLDEATKWVNMREIEKTVKKSIDERKIQEFLNEGNKIVFCENKNAQHFNNLTLPNVLFIPLKDKGDVYYNCINYPECIGLIDRDYLANEEINKIRNKHQNLFILKYYCFENYLYHPKNIEECLLELPTDYINHITYEKSTVKFKLYRNIDNNRKGYPMFKNSAGIFTEKEFGYGTEKVMEYLESNEFEIFYRIFDMKHYCGNIKEKINISTGVLASTNWFKQEICGILGIKI